MNLFKRFIKEFCFDKDTVKLYMYLILLIIASTIISVFRPALQGQVVDMLGTLSQSSKKILILFLGISFLGYLIVCVQRYVITLATERIAYKMRNKISDKLQTIETSFFDQSTFSDILLKSDKDVNIIKQCGVANIITLISNIILVIIIIPYMAKINIWMTMINVLLLSTIPFIGIYVGKKIKKASSEVLEKYEDFIQTLNDVFSNWSIIRIFSSYDYVTRRHENSNERYRQALTTQNYLYIINLGILMLIEVISVSFIWIAGSINVFRGEMTVGTILALAAYQGILFGPVSNLSSFINEIHTSKASLEDLYKFFEYKDRITTKIEQVDKIEKLTLSNVSFSYNEKAPIVLSDINLTFEKGKLYAICGKSGDGKSTLLSIIAGLLQADGEIFVNNTLLSDLSLESYWKHISASLQCSYFFLDTIKNNFKIGDPNASIEAIETMCKELDLLDDIMNLDEGLDSIIRGKGSNFSEGQGKRMGLSRSMLKDASIYLFDEPTASLDDFRKDLFLENMKALSKDSIVIFTTHNDKEKELANICIEL